MSIKNPLNLQASSATASLKLLLQGSGSFTIPATTSAASIVVTIPHNFGSDNLLWQVGFRADFGAGFGLNLMTPWISGDGRTSVNATINKDNLYITGYAQTAGAPTTPVVINYVYRLLVP